MHRIAEKIAHVFTGKGGPSHDGSAFCVVPWKHFHLCASGVVKPCCAVSPLRDSRGRLLTVYEQTLDHIWNSDSMRRIRRDMVEGKIPPECAFCASVEKNHGLSRRLRENAQWKVGRITLEGVSIGDLKDSARRQDYAAECKAIDLDLEINNLCNLSCRMCDADRSSQIEHDPVHSQWSGQKYKPTSFRPALNSRFDGGTHWLKDTGFVYGELLKEPKRIRKIQFVGGEPLLSPEVSEILDYFIKNGAPQNLIVSFTTNATVYEEKIFAKAGSFKRMVVAISLDDTGDRFEYIRYRAKWKEVERNIQKIIKTPNVYSMTALTLQAYNALNFTELLRFCDRHNLPFAVNAVVEPDQVSPAALPPVVRRIAVQRLQDYIENGCFDRHKRQVEFMINYLGSLDAAWNAGLFEKFLAFTSALDESRGQDFWSVYPELYGLIEEAKK